jgi:hypothetical protein
MLPINRDKREYRIFKVCICKEHNNTRINKCGKKYCCDNRTSSTR